MARRKRQSPTVESKLKPETQPEPESESPVFAAEAPLKQQRISVPLDAEGNIEWTGMRPETQDRLRRAFGFPGDGLPSETTIDFSKQEISAFYAMLGSFEAWAIHRWWKIPPEIANRVFAYGDDDLELLWEPTSKVLSKHASEWMRRWKDEIGLLLTLVFVHQRKVFMLNLELMKLAREAEAMRQAAESLNREQKTNGGEAASGANFR
jgi:hypothetical protein